jgi:hypothetical protein
VRPADKETNQTRDALGDYTRKTTYEVSRLTGRMKEGGYPAPLGDPTSGVVLVLEKPFGPRTLEALELSLQALRLEQAYVTYESTGLLAQEIQSTEPIVLVAIGAGAARDIDAIDYPLVRQPFSDAEPGVWFPWTKGTKGLLTPALAPALDDNAAKQRFWSAFLSLQIPAVHPKRVLEIMLFTPVTRIKFC